jgi:hypothetical protein
MTSETPEFDRRRAIRRALLFGAIGAGAAVGAAAAARAQALSDADVLNFALNLEYLEAEYYTRGVTGGGLNIRGADVRGGSRVSFANAATREILAEIAENERSHVGYLVSVLGEEAIPFPAVDFIGGFRAAGRAAGLGNNFNPFADDVSFMLGGYLFEDVGVTAYKGAAPLLRNPAILEAAAGILAVEGYHMGTIRSLLYQRGNRARRAANAISDARDALDGPEDLDQGIAVRGRRGGVSANVVPADRFARAFSRTPQQVLNIVYLTPASGVAGGGFFPAGVNGAIRTT